MIARAFIAAAFVVGFVALGAFASYVSDANDSHRIEQREMQR